MCQREYKDQKGFRITEKEGKRLEEESWREGESVFQHSGKKQNVLAKV